MADDDELEALPRGDGRERRVVRASTVSEREPAAGRRLGSIGDDRVTIGDHTAACPRRLIVEQPAIRPGSAAIAGCVDAVGTDAWEERAVGRKRVATYRARATRWLPLLVVGSGDQLVG